MDVPQFVDVFFSEAPLGCCSSGCPGGLELSVLGAAVELLAYSCAALPSPAQHR